MKAMAEPMYMTTLVCHINTPQHKAAASGSKGRQLAARLTTSTIQCAVQLSDCACLRLQEAAVAAERLDLHVGVGGRCLQLRAQVAEVGRLPFGRRLQLLATLLREGQLAAGDGQLGAQPVSLQVVEKGGDASTKPIGSGVELQHKLQSVHII